MDKLQDIVRNVSHWWDEMRGLADWPIPYIDVSDGRMDELYLDEDELVAQLEAETFYCVCCDQNEVTWNEPYCSYCDNWDAPDMGDMSMGFEYLVDSQMDYHWSEV